jgi:hypothetical protein
MPGGYAPDEPDATFCPKCQPIRGRFAAMLERAHGRAETSFNRRACKLVRVLSSTLAAIDEFLKRHDDDCECDHCVNWPDNSYHIVSTLEGIRWPPSVGESLMRDETIMSAAELAAELETELSGEVEEPAIVSQ